MTSAKSRAIKVMAQTTRILLASIGGYLLAIASAAFVARALPTTRIEAVLTGTMLALPVMVAAAITAYGCHRVRDAALWIIGLTLALGGLAWAIAP